MTEHRISPRHRVLKAGTIAFSGAAIDCTIRNLSSTGACLEVASPLGIPSLFTLVVETDHSKRTCTVVWRTESRIGVTFA
jgi:PilZ domain